MNSLQQQVCSKLEIIVYKNITQEELNKNHIPYEIIYGRTACELPCYILKKSNGFSVHEDLYVDKDIFDAKVLDLFIHYWPFAIHIDTRLMPQSEAKDQLFSIDNGLCEKILKKIEFLESDYDSQYHKRFL